MNAGRCGPIVGTRQRACPEERQVPSSVRFVADPGDHPATSAHYGEVKFIRDFMKVLCLLFIGLSGSDKLGEDLDAEGKLFPTGQGRIRCETLSNEVCGEREQARSRMGEHKFSQLLIQLMKGNQPTLE